MQLDLAENRAGDTFERPPSHRFRRRQSELYQMIHTSPDPEIEIDLVEQSLREINDQLITESECEYIFYVRIICSKNFLITPHGGNFSKLF